MPGFGTTWVRARSGSSVGTTPEYAETGWRRAASAYANRTAAEGHVEFEPRGPAEAESVGEHEQHEHPRIYVASLSDYVNGVLHGEWMNAAQDDDALLEQIAAMLARSPTTPRAEEFAIHDYDNFGEYRVGEHEPLEKVTKIARGIAEHGPAFAAWASSCDDAEQIDHFDDAYIGSYDSLQEYGEDVLDCGGLERIIERHVPESFRQYVRLDVEAFVNDLIAGGDIDAVAHSNGVWIFEGNR